MKQEIFKVNYESYTMTMYNDIMPIDFPHPTNSYWKKEIEDEILERFVEVSTPKTKRKPGPLFLENYTSHVEQDYFEHYGNPLCRVLKSYVMIVVERDGDKVSMKLYSGLRERKAGNCWFKISRNVTFISVNTKTGDVYTGYLKNYQRKKKFTKKICKNFFGDEPINSFMLSIRDCVWSYIHNHNEVILESVSKFIYEVDGRSDSDELTYEKRLFKFYLDKKGIKYPNNFHLYSSKLIGPKIRKLLKKNDFRLVDTFMEYNDLSGKKLKKALHTCSRLNIDLYKKTKKLFGDDWINQDENFISNTLNCEYGIGDRSIPNEFVDLVSKDELRKVFHTFKKVFFENLMDTYTYIDHINLYTDLKMYGETDLKWTTTDVESTAFRNEHLDWTDKLSFYKLGNYERIYPNYTYELLEEKMLDYYPVVLNSSTNYNEESSVQSNCVKSYIGKPSSIIISVRKGSRISNERATIEYQLSKVGDKIKCRRIQSLGKFNGKLPESWLYYLVKLDMRMSDYINHKNFETVKITKKCSNGIEIHSDSYWDEDGLIKWTHKTIDGPHTIQYQWL